MIPQPCIRYSTLIVNNRLYNVVIRPYTYLKTFLVHTTQSHCTVVASIHCECPVSQLDAANRLKFQSRLVTLFNKRAHQSECERTIGFCVVLK